MNKIDGNDFKEFLDFRGKQESQFMIRADDVHEEVLELFSHGGEMQGVKLPWAKTHGKFQLRPGEVTCWAGINGHGKSQLLGQVCAFTVPYEKWVIASMEMKPQQTIKRMYHQMSGLKNPSVKYLNQLRDALKQNLWVYDQLDTVAGDRILAMVHYAATKLGATQIVVDSLMKCGVGTDDYNAQKIFIDRLCWAAKTTGVHIHIVHHIRKKEREGQIPDKFDIKGAGEIADLVDNIVIVHRNKDKEKDIREGKEVDKGVPDARMIVAKQRHEGIEEGFNLWFDSDSQQFIPKPGYGPMPWPNPEDKYQ